ncbi:MAG: murein biosynthesis integral membrane protein MurJ [Candidatus Aquicultor sp.]
MSRGKSLAISAVTVTIATFLGRIFGFVREMVIANKFGANASTDAFLVAFRIPNIIYSLVVMGALSASFIPIFTGLLANEKEKDAWRLAHTIFNLLLIIFGVITVALVLFAPKVTYLLAPGFKTPGQHELAANLLRIMAPALIFMGISGLMAGILNSYNHFAAPSLVALVQNVLMVGSIIIFSASMGIYGTAVGLLLGSIGQVVIQLPFVIKRGLAFRPTLSLKHEDLATVGKLFIPVLIGLGASQSNTVIDTWMASFLSVGSITYLNVAFKVGSLPLNTLIAAIAIVLFPMLSKHAARDDVDSLKNTVSLGIRMVALVAIPSTVGLFVLSLPIIKLLFQHGAFGPDATRATAPALAAYSFGLFAMGLNMLIVRAFYALKDGVTPMKASIAFVVMLVGLDIVFMRFMGHVGLAVGYAFAVSLMVLILLRGLRKRLDGINELEIIRSLSKILVSALAMGVATWAASGFLTGLLDSGSKLHELIIVTASFGVGVAVYIALLVLLKADEVILAWQAVRSKLSRSGLASDGIVR